MKIKINKYTLTEQKNLSQSVTSLDLAVHSEHDPLIECDIKLRLIEKYRGGENDEFQ